jgi:hypothetical protein
MGHTHLHHPGQPPRRAHLARLDFAATERGLHDQAETGNPWHVSKRLFAGGVARDWMWLRRAEAVGLLVA